jgi:hypothetical protein
MAAAGHRRGAELTFPVDAMAEAPAGPPVRPADGLVHFVSWCLAHRGAVTHIARRGRDLLLQCPPRNGAVRVAGLGSLSAGTAGALIANGEIDRLIALHVDRDGRLLCRRAVTLAGRGRLFRTLARWLPVWLPRPTPAAAAPEGKEGYFTTLELAAHAPDLLDFLALGAPPAPDGTPRAVPFDRPAALPPSIPAAPRTRSVLFVHNSYYHFKYLAAALKERGWDAMTMAVEAPNSPHRQFYHGEDLTIYHPDLATQREQIRAFFRTVPERFGAVHFYGQDQPAMFPDNFLAGSDPYHLPWDFLELRRHNVIIGYMPSGCCDGASQTSIHALTRVCDRCVWQLRPDVCNDAKNLAWARELAALCDVVTLEGDHAVDDRTGPRFVRRPIVTALDPAFWRPELPIPEERRVARVPGELLVYHAFGNAEIRRVGGRDIKGSGAVFGAVDRLRAEGLPIQLLYATDVPSTEVRFCQAQADIVIDQLNYGRLGANAREALMLGKPLITRLLPEQGSPLPPLQTILEVPAIDASEATIETVLRDLARDAPRRARMAEESRRFALAWHAAPVCALRYERVIDRIRAGLAPEADEVFA